MSRFGIIQGFLDGIRPVERLKPSDWADKYRYLSSISSASPGRWKTSKTPYLKEVMDRFSPYDEAQEIVVMKGAQIGFSECGFNIVGYCIDLDPCPIMYVMPTVETIRKNSRMRIEPMISATPNLKQKVSENKSRDKSATILHKDFPGGTLLLSGANSASSLRSVPIRVLVLDEVDAYPPDLDGEGSPVDLAKARTRTFKRKKIFMLSTPTIEGQSIIQQEFDKTSQRKFYLPCPHCGEMQFLEWSRVRWQKPIKENPNSAIYLCVGCEAEIPERFKTWMLQRGEWRDTIPANIKKTVVGYHLNSLYSPLGWYSWSEAAADFEDAKTTEKLKVFINTVLGETWKEKGEAPDWQLLYDRRERYETNAVPNDVAVVTAGVDVQRDRLEVEIVGWCRGKRSYSIDYRVLIGDTSGPIVWEELAKMVNEKWERADGVILNLSRMAIDTGYNTQAVYKFCRKYHPSQVVPVKGQDRQAVVVSAPAAVDKTTKGKKAGSLGLFNIGVSILKSEIYGNLKLKRNEDGTLPDGYCHFPDAYDDSYFKMLTAEQLQKEFVKGFPRYVWVKIRERNEALDCRVYARAAAAIVGIDRWRDSDWEAVQQSYTTSRAPNSTQSGGGERKRRKSNYW